MSELAGSLLQVITRGGQPKPRKGSVPLFMEFPVNADLAPFLVTRASSGQEMSLWVSRTKGGHVKAGIREVPSLEDYFVEVVNKVWERGHVEQWGNVHPLSRAGLQGAIDHLNDYGFDDLEMLVNPKIPWGTVEPEWDNTGRGMVLTLLGLPVQPAVWVPIDTIVIVPRDREMVGFTFLTYGAIASVVHNAARGIGIASSRGEQGEE